jgi:putative Ca2+/H+ antiporter (TMEM165/GDT1 family)
MKIYKSVILKIFISIISLNHFVKTQNQNTEIVNSNIDGKFNKTLNAPEENDLNGNIRSNEISNSTINAPLDLTNNNAALTDPVKNIEQINNNFIDGLIKGFSIVFIAEVGDRTFILIMIYSIANGYLKTFLISNLVLLSWNLLSILIGLNMQYYINRNYVEWFGIVLFAIFGFMMIKDGFEMENNSVEEEFLKEKEELEKANKSNTDTNDEENQISYLKNDNNLDDNLLNKNDKDNSKLFNSVWAFGFTLLMAEFGDKSQIAAIIIGATLNLYGVILGTSLAHSICTVIAIVFGRIFSHYVTTKQITMIGGLIFLLFSILFLIEKL